MEFIGSPKMNPAWLFQARDSKHFTIGKKTNKGMKDGRQYVFILNLGDTLQDMRMLCWLYYTSQSLLLKGGLYMN